jgi:hypothetical protein
MGYKSLLNPAVNDVSHTSELTRVRNAQAMDDLKGFENGNFCENCKKYKILPALEYAETVGFCSRFSKTTGINSSCNQFQPQTINTFHLQYTLLNHEQKFIYYGKYIETTNPR